jgi:hypothetical protein
MGMIVATHCDAGNKKAPHPGLTIHTGIKKAANGSR